ncbi:TPA: S1 RNA-binding domain-containing protein [Candidatus Woesearchaeota archaeon]|nr:S1 RNA-binding domain-containing protein [Candidatus Woesearchaeota archaeon]
MFHRRHGYPAEDDILLCTVTSVQYNSVFCSLDEYDGKGGMIHISEVTAGRIKNIREYVSEGRKVVCKVLRVDKERGHIDLSLRRVTEGQRRDKNAALKQEQRAENIIDHIAKESKKDPAAFYAEVAPAILEHYEYLYLAFEDIVDDKFKLTETSLPAALAKKIEDTVRERIKPKSVTIEGVFSISTFAEGGVALVRDALIKGREAAAPADVRYLGAGSYKISVTAEEFKDAEKRLKAAVDAVEGSFKKSPATEVKFDRIEVEK